MQNIDYRVKYTGSLRTLAVHLKSNSEIETDAPVDNNGKGEKFSPTDLVATAVASCMLTVIGIHFNKQGKELEEITCNVSKVMDSNPRRIVEIYVNFDFGKNEFSEKEFRSIERIAMACPVANSLNSEILIATNLASFYHTDEELTMS